MTPGGLGGTLIVESRRRRAIGVNPRALGGRQVPSLRPAGAEFEKQHEAAQTHRGASEEARRIRTCVIAYRSEHGWEHEATEASGRTNDAGHETDAHGKSLRHELEYGAVAHAEERHRHEE